MTRIDEEAERIRLANEALRANLQMLRNDAGVSACDLLLFDVRAAGIGTVAEVIETLMASVDALSARVAVLELQ